MVDVTSVKEIPSQTMKESLPDDIEYLPTHPIFGPRTTELDNQVIVLTPDKKESGLIRSTIIWIIKI